jgi:chorismate dehydratase
MVELTAVEKPDAAIVIGDRALCSDPAPEGDIDLGEAWKKWTGLPFVFAVWAVRSGFSETEAATEIAHKAYAAGFLATEEIAERYADKLGGSIDFWADYLDQTIHYRLDPQDLEGLALFRKHLSE